MEAGMGSPAEQIIHWRTKHANTKSGLRLRIEIESVEELETLPTGT